MNQDTFTEILLQSNVSEYPRLAQTNQIMYKILNSEDFWITKYIYVGLSKNIFDRYTSGGDLQDFIDDYNNVIEHVKEADILLWILKVEASDKNDKRFISYGLEYNLDYLSLESGDKITIKRGPNLYQVQCEEMNLLLDEDQTRELLTLILYEGHTVFDNRNQPYIAPGRRFGLIQAYKYINNL